VFKKGVKGRKKKKKREGGLWGIKSEGLSFSKKKAKRGVKKKSRGERKKKREELDWRRERERLPCTRQGGR